MTHLNAINVSLETPSHRPLIRDLQMRLEAERVAVVGRNGVGKSLLLEVLAGHTEPASGLIECVGTRHFVPQFLDGRTRSVSPGVLRRQLLDAARDARPDFLLLDEPSQDLDAQGIAWLGEWLRDWDTGLVVVTHDRRLLRLFDGFFVVAESGCRLFQGNFDELLRDLEQRAGEAEQVYASELCRLADKEERNAANRRRRARKKAGGRPRELDRCTPRCQLNQKRSAAQAYQGKRERIREQRIAAARALAKETRRALAVDLPLQVTLPTIPERTEPIVELRGVGATANGGRLFSDLTLELSRPRLAVVGPNASGKTTLLEYVTGNRQPELGTVRFQPDRIGYIAQHGSNWRTEESLFDHLFTTTDRPPAEVASVLAAHRFPLALAERPLRSLSPGERTRAALLCLFQRDPPVELLVLDEPTDQLDLLGVTALERVLAAWSGGLIVVSHDPEFLEHIDVRERLQLGSDVRERLQLGTGWRWSRLTASIACDDCQCEMAPS